MGSPQQWREVYEGGTAEAERLAFDALSLDILKVQAEVRRRSNASAIERAFHAKIVLGVDNARLRVLADVPARFRVGYFKPGAEYRAIVRLSNANGARGADYMRDMRGVAIRVAVSDQEQHDLLATNFPVSHARNAGQFVTFAKAMAGSKVLMIPRLVLSVGPFETIRMLKTVIAASGRAVRSLALETYWSRGAILWGDAGPVRFLLRPSRDAPSGPELSLTDPDYLHHEIAARLNSTDVVFDLCLQPFVDETRTPIEDGAVEWLESVSPSVPVATLTIPRQDVDAVAMRTVERLIDEIAFNPWHTTDDFRPLGNLNRVRKAAYLASSAHRLNYRFYEPVPLRNVVSGWAAAGLFKIVNRFVPWHRLGWHLGLLNLSIFREELRKKNLIDTEDREAPPRPTSVLPSIPEALRTVRTFDGSYNDLSDPEMGKVNATFGRNMLPKYRPDQFDLPDPIVVSRELMHRDAFIPARSLNMLAAAWIQFQVHDWVNHPRHDLGEPDNDIVLPLPKGEKWRSRDGGPEESVMRIADNQISRYAATGYPVFRNQTTPWWDGSEIYGADADSAKLLRSGELRDGAFLRLEDGYLPDDANGRTVTGFSDSWWLGLSMMHTLFAREHNLVCEALKRAYPDWSEERVYQTARLIVSALIAKIHTVEWTPAILATKTIEVGLRANWYGAPKDWLSQLGVWLLDAHGLTGIPQTLPDHHAAPYSLTEEFTAVYRLHPLIPDDYQFFDQGTGQSIGVRTFGDIQGEKADPLIRELRLHNVIYSLGITHPGAITLHNYPRSLQSFKRSNGEIIDLSIVDVVRDRRRGVPRFNDFREALHKPRIRHWEELSSDPETVKKLRELYREIDAVDTMVGLHAEPPPAGFGFSDTAFRVFILMASRRLQSDRFLTVDYRPEIYSPLGLDWIDKNSMTSVVLRHCPQLSAVLPRTASAFAPFRPIAA